MATSVDLITISQNVVFQNRVTYALYSAAIAVLSEDNKVQGHAQRSIYAKSILDGNSKIANIAIAVLTNTTISTEADVTKTTNGDFAIPDGDIQFAVNTFFSALAGVTS